MVAVRLLILDMILPKEIDMNKECGHVLSSPFSGDPFCDPFFL
jgi:hypothetical protein